jgi:hypothetical protein
MNRLMNKFLQPKVTFRNVKLWENLYGEDSHPPSSFSHFVPEKYTEFHCKFGKWKKKSTKFNFKRK